MLEHKKLLDINNYFDTLDKRKPQGVYFYRINNYSQSISDFIKKYYDAARKNGVIIEGKIPNPDENNLAYYSEIMGMDFKLDINFIVRSLKKWLPRMSDFQCKNVGNSIYSSLLSMRNTGKTENMLKNAYIKFMCWLYYKFERIVNQLGDNIVPKILYEGSISKYELMLVTILSNAGCDVVLLQYQGDDAYLKLDPESRLSDLLVVPNVVPFPKIYSLKFVQKQIQEDFNTHRLYGALPNVTNCTNAWIKGKGFDDIIEFVGNRGSDTKFYYNCFYRIYGAEDKLIYSNSLLQMQQELKAAKRRFLIVNNEIPRPTNDEIASIKREHYSGVSQMISGLARNFKSISNLELQKIINKAFIDLMLYESKKESNNVNKLTNKAVYLLCWLHRYYSQLFSNWKMPDIGAFIYLGGCKNDSESLFLSFLARLPVDVLILCPNLNTHCCLEDELLYEIHNSESINLDCFPQDSSQVRIGTVAYHAERELDTIMYQDSGLYRNQQYSKANVINLQTMYEEIKILWDTDLKYRPSFSTTDDAVNVPVIFAKVSGVKNGETNQYWSSIKDLITEDTLLITRPPYIDSLSPNPMKSYAPEFFKNGKLYKNKIKSHPKYPYGILREDMQEYMLEKLRIMIENRLIKGIGENGTEYTVIAQVLNLPKEIVRMLQKFDFTKKNPKLIYINTTEKIISLEDSILITFLNLIGFDVVFFIPTGYQCIEKYFTTNIVEEHQIGDYKYDMVVPNFDAVPSSNTHANWYERIFKRGN